MSSGMHGARPCDFAAETVQQLELKGNLYVSTKQEVDKVLHNVPPVKWLTAMDDIEDVLI